MSDKTDEATLQVMLERLLNFRLPRALALKKRIDRGEPMTDSDVAFMKSALQDAHDGQKFVVRNPQFHAVGTQIVQLYDDIVRKAAENEKGA